MNLYPCDTGSSHRLSLKGSDLVYCDLGDTMLSGQGCVVSFSLCLKHVLPDRRLAVAVALAELDDQDQEFPRGLRTYTVPPLTGREGGDVLLRSIRFILPQDLSLSQSGERRFTARVDAHYVDCNASCQLEQV